AGGCWADCARSSAALLAASGWLEQPAAKRAASVTNANRGAWIRLFIALSILSRGRGATVLALEIPGGDGEVDQDPGNVGDGSDQGRAGGGGVESEAAQQ